MQKITGSMALHLIRAAVEEKGSEYIYVNNDGDVAGQVNHDGVMPNCYYLHDAMVDGEPGKVPGCIIGHVAKRMGVQDSLLEQEENNTSDALMDSIMLLTDESDDARFDITDVAKRVFRAAQSMQDKGKTWGDAYAYAREQYVSAKLALTPADQRLYLIEVGVL